MLLCLLVAVGGALFRTHETPKTYRSDAKLFINLPAARDTQEALQGVQLSTNLVKSYAQIATSRTSAARIKDRLGIAESPAQIASEITATVEPQTVIITISAVNSDRARARDIAQAAAAVLNDTITALEQDRERTGAVEARIIDDATLPGSPIDPRPARNLVLGVVLGLLAGLGLALLLDALDRTVKSTAEAERLVGAPGLALVPRARDLAKHPVITTYDVLSATSEAYRTLRTSVRFIEPDQPLRSLVVTSPIGGDGKTTTAVNLAVALAQSGERVILVDADLRRPNVATMLGINGAVGLSDVIMGDAGVAASLQRYNDQLQVLPAGTLPPNPSELLGSQRMTRLLEELTGLADIVVFDAPPVLPVTDAVVLSAQTDGVALVLRHGTTTRATASESARRLLTVEADLVGFVLNGAPRAVADGRYVQYRRVGVAASERPTSVG